MSSLFKKNKTKLFSWRKKSTTHAVILGVAAAFCYSLMICFAKLLAARTTGSMTVFFRFAVSLLWVLLVLGYKRSQGKSFSLKTKHPWLQMLRSGGWFCRNICFIYSAKICAVS